MNAQTWLCSETSHLHSHFFVLLSRILLTFLDVVAALCALLSIESYLHESYLHTHIQIYIYFYDGHRSRNIMSYHDNTKSHQAVTATAIAER